MAHGCVAVFPVFARLRQPKARTRRTWWRWFGLVYRCNTCNLGEASSGQVGADTHLKGKI
ncbi:hypothetical protein Hanom_Chr09g00825151 [Helianthus anomalus]